MIVDTSTLIAIALHEPGRTELLDAISYGGFTIPAPVLVEADQLCTGRYRVSRPDLHALLAELREVGNVGLPFGADDAALAVEANDAFGTGNGKGGTLNLFDLMVYAVAKRLNLPILCTGKDFAATDALIHPASRIG